MAPSDTAGRHAISSKLALKRWHPIPVFVSYRSWVTTCLLDFTFRDIQRVMVCHRIYMTDTLSILVLAIRQCSGVGLVSELWTVGLTARYEKGSVVNDSDPARSLMPAFWSSHWNYIWYYPSTNTITRHGTSLKEPHTLKYNTSFSRLCSSLIFLERWFFFSTGLVLWRYLIYQQRSLSRSGALACGPPRLGRCVVYLCASFREFEWWRF